MISSGIDIIIHFHLFTENRKMYFPILPTEHLKIIKYFMLRHQTMAVLQQKHRVLNIFGRQGFISVLCDDSATASPDVHF